MLISSNDVVKLPLHDARIVALNIATANGGYLAATLDVKLNPEEPPDPLRQLGITASELRIIFGKCWRIRTSVMGFTTSQEVISSLEIAEQSELRQSLLTNGLGTRSMVHFRIHGSSGSQLDFLAETFSIEER